MYIIKLLCGFVIALSMLSIITFTVSMNKIWENSFLNVTFCLNNVIKYKTDDLSFREAKQESRGYESDPSRWVDVELLLFEIRWQIVLSVFSRKHLNMVILFFFIHNDGKWVWKLRNTFEAFQVFEVFYFLHIMD